jgi:uncharacterized protein YdeI (YjbR/CyaY-like superfamily)
LTAPLPFATPADWHAWLAANHERETEVWLLYHKKASGVASVDWQQAVVQALIWGWIDGIRKSLDETTWVQRFTPRKPGSAWSQINRAHAERLIAEGLMQPPGLRQVQIAQANGRWDSAYAGGKAGDLPQSFLDALARAPQSARDNHAKLNARDRYAIYYRLTSAKRLETQAKRIAEFIDKLTHGQPVV